MDVFLLIVVVVLVAAALWWTTRTPKYEDDVKPQPGKPRPPADRGGRGPTVEKE